MVSRDELRERFLGYDDAKLQRIVASSDYSEDAQAVARQILSERSSPFRGSLQVNPESRPVAREESYDPRSLRLTFGMRVLIGMSFVAATVVLGILERSCR